MKVCASCGASLPDGAAFCIGCGSKEFVSETLPDLDAPQPEKPKIEYDQYGRPIGQEYAQPQYEEPRFTQSYEDYDQSYSQGSDYPQYIEQYSEQMSQQYQPQYGQQYQQPQYGQQYQQPQYGQQYQQPQYEQQYQQPQYEQQYQQPQYEQQYQQPQYEQQYQQPQYEQQPVVYSEDEYEQPQTVEPQPQQNVYHSEHTAYVPDENEEESDFDPYAAAEKKDDFDPYEAAKNFKFEKKEDEPEKAQEPEETPKNLKGILAKYQDTKDHTYEYDQNTFSANKQTCKLAVLGITFWVPFVAAKDCGAARFYANQGLLIFIIEVLLLIPELIFTGIIGVGLTLGAQIIVGILLDLIITAIVYAVPIFMIVTAFKNINQGKVKDVPFVGRIRIIK